MATQIQAHQPQPQRDDSKKDEARQEEVEKKNLEEELREMDAHGFYNRLKDWSTKEFPKPYYRTSHLALVQNKEMLWQPLPITRSDEREILFLSKNTGKVLSLLRRVDQKGLECPYVHQVNKESLEEAIDKCKHLEEASLLYLSSKGFLARFSQLFNRLHILRALRDIAVLQRRLEAIVIMCRHQEFAQDLMRIRREVTFRTGNVLKDDDIETRSPVSKREKSPPSAISRPQPGKNAVDQLLRK